MTIMSFCAQQSVKMDKLIFSLLLFIHITYMVTATGVPAEKYSWRDFYGIIPPDALQAGTDKRGKPIYIGQALANGKLIPGRITQGDDNIYYESGQQAWSTNKNVKIFCTDNPDDFRWVSTKRHEVLGLGERLINGGHEPNCTVYIGRVNKTRKFNVGKVICNEDDCLALYVNQRGFYREYHSFEVLAYSPKSDNDILENDFV